VSISGGNLHQKLAKSAEVGSSPLSLKNCSWGLFYTTAKDSASYCTMKSWLQKSCFGQPWPSYSDLPYLPSRWGEVVGVTQLLMGNSSPALKALQTKANSLQEILKSNFLPCSLLWQALFHVLWPLLQYSLGVLTFSPTQASQLVSQLFQTLLPHLGVNWHLPVVAIQYASAKYQSLGLLNPFWEQGISALSLFLEHANADSTELVLIHASLELLHLELGSISSNLFDLPYNTWSFLATDCWLKFLWRFIDSTQIKIATLSL